MQRGGTPAIVPTVVALAQTVGARRERRAGGARAGGTVERRLHARALAGTALLELTYDDPSAAQAAQVAQQAASTLESLVAARFPALRVAVVDPAHPVSGAGKPVLRDTLIGALLGLLAGAALAARGKHCAKVPDEPGRQSAVSAQAGPVPSRSPVAHLRSPSPSPSRSRSRNRSPVRRWASWRS